MSLYKAPTTPNFDCAKIVHYRTLHKIKRGVNAGKLVVRDDYNSSVPMQKQLHNNNIFFIIYCETYKNRQGNKKVYIFKNSADAIAAYTLANKWGNYTFRVIKLRPEQMYR
jgi:hypothetical protein